MENDQARRSEDEPSHSVEKVDRELEGRLVNERAGSPVIRSFADTAALEHAVTLMDLTQTGEPKYPQYLVRREVIWERMRGEEMGENADIYRDARIVAKEFILKYVSAIEKTHPHYSALERHAAAANRMGDQMRHININKAHLQKPGRSDAHSG